MNVCGNQLDADQRQALTDGDVPSGGKDGKTKSKREMYGASAMRCWILHDGEAVEGDVIDSPMIPWYKR